MPTQYLDDPALGFRGMISQNFTSPQMIESGLVEPVAGIQVGDGVEAGTAAGQYIALATAANFAGIAIYFAGIEKARDSLPTDPLILKQNKQMAVMNRGRVWVEAGGAVAKGAEVVPSTGAGTKFTAGFGAGQVRAVALTAAAADGDLIQIELTSPVLAPADA